MQSMYCTGAGCSTLWLALSASLRASTWGKTLSPFSVPHQVMGFAGLAILHFAVRLVRQPDWQGTRGEMKTLLFRKKSQFCDEEGSIVIRSQSMYAAPGHYRLYLAAIHYYSECLYTAPSHLLLSSSGLPDELGQLELGVDVERILLDLLGHVRTIR
jgi:hypothetical protein